MTSQAHRLWNLLRDGKAHRTDEILREVYGNDHAGLARVGARIYDIQKKHPEVRIESWPDPENRKLWYYQMRKQRLTSFPQAYPTQPVQHTQPTLL